MKMTYSFFMQSNFTILWKKQL